MQHRKIVAVVGLALAVALTGCAAPTDVTTKTSTKAGGGKSHSAAKGDDNTTTVGHWATAADGITLRVWKLKRGRVSDVASGGHVGDPAVIVYVQIRNGSSKRFDLSLVQVEARIGADGQEAEEVFQDEFGEGFSGSLTPGRTVTQKFMFAAKKTADLKKVSIEVTPGFDYEGATFEGGL